VLRLFPSPLPDECLASLVCRYHLMSANANSEVTRRQLAESPLLKGDLHVLNAQISPGPLADRLGMSTEQMVDTFTTRPLLAWLGRNPIEAMSFVSPMMQVCRADFGYRNRIDGAGVRLAHCEACVDEDRSTYGVSYWHRAHQPETRFSHSQNVLFTPACCQSGRFILRSHAR
jgi:hypothetical protein